MTQAQKAEMYARIQQHGENLNAIFNTGIEPVELCKKLRRWENKAHNLCVLECNTGADKDDAKEKILESVKKLLFPDKTANLQLLDAVFINGDPRGYALKIKSGYMREHGLKLEQDWGEYGLIAPDFTPIN